MTEQAGAVDASERVWHPIGAIYARRNLDTLIDLAVAVAHNFDRQPTQYLSVDEQLAETMSRFKHLLGRDPDWPDAPQRVALSGSVLDGLAIAMAGLRKAAIVFVERGAGSAEPRLRRAVQEAAQVLRVSGGRVEGAVTAMAERRLGAISGQAAAVLSSQAIYDANGLPSARADGRTGFEPLLNPDLALLYGTINRPTIRPPARRPLAEYKLSTIQRIARHGADAISLALGSEEDDGQLDAAVESAYNWARALQDLEVGIDVARAWLDQAYLFSLEVAERDILPPNPAGDIELESPELNFRAVRDVTVMEAFAEGTSTVSGEICCSSGICSEYCETTRIGFTCRSSGGCICAA